MKQGYRIAKDKPSSCLRETSKHLETGRLLYSILECQKSRAVQHFDKSLSDTPLEHLNIDLLRSAISKPLNEQLKKLAEKQEMLNLTSLVSELLEFKRRFEAYEPLLKLIEKESHINEEVQREINSVETKKLQAIELDEFINKTLFMTKDDYEQIMNE